MSASLNIGQPKKHLFFIQGPVPTPEQLDEASKIAGFCCFRNALLIVEGEACEDFDQLHGDIPVNYQRAAVAKERGEQMEASPLSETMGETIDNGDGTKTTTTTWRPNAGA